mmetsp:Transcript_99325/g.280338  ORF Transcript_99325/g.280338 Transcript_99325/m.280338 type:complete len:239 (-) Transcript_99325:37-753(-)
MRLRSRRGVSLFLAAAGAASPRLLAWRRWSPALVAPRSLRCASFSDGRDHRSFVSAAAAMPITVFTTEDAEEKAAKVASAAKAECAADVSIDVVKSYYWWDGAVQFDPEWRVAASTEEPFEKIRDGIAKAHSYDLPMIIYDLEAAPAEHKYWKGQVNCSDEEGATKLAKALVERRVVACAQATSEGALAVKTVADCKAHVDEAVAPASMQWSAIGGNEGYLQWLKDECKAAAKTEASP